MNSRSMAGWIGFAGIVMVILGGLTFFEGLIALLRDNYYAVVPSGLPGLRHHRLGLDHVVLGDPPGVYRSRSARRRKLGAVDDDRAREHQRLRPTWLSRQHETRCGC